MTSETLREPDWQVLLLGGSSGTGKTTLAPRLALRFGAWCSQVDDFRLVLQRFTTPEQNRALHFFTATERVWERSPEELCERMAEVGRVVSSSLEIAIANHVATRAPLVLEGDGLVPSLGAHLNFGGLEVEEGQVRAVFLYEPEEEIIRRNMWERERGFQRFTTEERRTQARTAWLYGRWLRREAERCGLPVIECRPWESLEERALVAIGATQK